MLSIFSNTNFYNLSDPQPTWLYEVAFMGNNNTSLMFNNALKKDLIPTSVSLPSHTTEIVTLNYFGSEKSFPVLRTYGGDCEMTFDVRSDDSENYNLYALTQLLAISEMRFFDRDAAKGLDTPHDKYFYHPEIESEYSIHSDVKSKNSTNFPHRKIDTIIVRLKDRRGTYGGSESYHSIYEYYNCIITNFSFNENLDYNSESKLTCKLTFHYDMWHKIIDSFTSDLYNYIDAKTRDEVVVEETESINNNIIDNKWDQEVERSENIKKLIDKHIKETEAALTASYLNHSYDKINEQFEAVKNAPNEARTQTPSSVGDFDDSEWAAEIREREAREERNSANESYFTAMRQMDAEREASDSDERLVTALKEKAVEEARKDRGGDRGLVIYREPEYTETTSSSNVNDHSVPSPKHKPIKDEKASTPLFNNTFNATKETEKPKITNNTNTYPYTKEEELSLLKSINNKIGKLHILPGTDLTRDEAEVAEHYGLSVNTHTTRELNAGGIVGGNTTYTLYDSDNYNTAAVLNGLIIQKTNALKANNASITSPTGKSSQNSSNISYDYDGLYTISLPSTNTATLPTTASFTNLLLTENIPVLTGSAPEPTTRLNISYSSTMDNSVLSNIDEAIGR